VLQPTKHHRTQTKLMVQCWHDKRPSTSCKYSLLTHCTVQPQPYLLTFETEKWHTRYSCPETLAPILFFTHESSYCFQRILAIAILSIRLSVCLSITRVDQSKTAQARITKSSPSAAWKTLVSGIIKLFHKFEGGHPERGC